MLQNQSYQNEVYSGLSSLPATQQQQIISVAISQHRTIVQKLIPEIEWHLIQLASNIQTNDKYILLTCLKWLTDFGKEIHEHILFEEEHVFSELKKTEVKLSTKTISFITHHDDYEQQLMIYLIQMKNSLKHLEAEMSFRILILKLESLYDLMMEHAELEKVIMKH